MSVKIVQRLFTFVAILALILGMGGTGQVSAQDPTPRPQLPHGNLPHQPVDLSPVAPLMEKAGPAKVVVILEQPSLVTLALQARENGLQLAPQQAQVELTGILRAQDTLQAQLESPQIGGTTLFKNQRVYNGIALKVDSSKLVEIAALPGVAAVHPLETHTIDNAYASDLIGAKDVWNSLAAGLSYTGKDVSIAVIDTGIDFLHRNFGGDANYEDAASSTEDFTIADSDVFPTAKVVGGYDFVGDDYNANNPAADTPAPDPIPMDCNGHGSHVAGSAAGFGVTEAGETFEGPWTNELNTLEMHIGPGMAPQADLYALRVFGCGGSTNVTDKAIEWAVDPNGDGDMSDHVDVINMSLGSDFGGPESSSTIAAEAAVRYGVIVVASSGNSGDTTFVTGSPAVATSAINVAASMDAYTVMDGFIVNEPEEIAGEYGALTAVSWPSSITEVTDDLKYPSDQEGNTDGCSPFPDGYFDGTIALLDWTLPQECGSAVRAKNATDEGAVGVLMVYEAPILDITIAGSSIVPSMITTQDVGAVIKGQIAAGETVNVTLTTELNASVEVIDPAQDDLVAGFSSRGPRVGDLGLKPDIAAPGMSIFSTASGVFLGEEGLEYGTGEDGVSFNGTSMASPIVAGSMAILREQHPDWTAEELKALIMNTATHDIYTELGQTGQVFSPDRVGAGRVDVQQAVETDVIVYNDVVPGAVSVSFGNVQVAPADVYINSRTVTVENKGTESATYSLSYSAVTDNPGVAFALRDMADQPASSISVAPGTTKQFKVVVTVTAAELRNVQDAAQEVQQETVYGNLPRIWLSDETGLVLLSGGGNFSLRLPVNIVASPVASMSAVESGIIIRDEPSGTIDINLTGTGVDTTGGTFEGYPREITSLVSVFELAATSPRLPTASRLEQMADLQAVGITTDFPVHRNDADEATGMDDAYVYFGIATYGEWNTPSELQFEVYMDVNQDGNVDYVLFTGPARNAGGDPTDALLTYLYNANTTLVAPQDFINFDLGLGANTALFNNNVMVLPVIAGEDGLGLTSEDGTFDYFVATWSAVTGELVDITDPMTYDAANPLVHFNNGVAGLPAYFDLPGEVITVAYDQTSANEEAPFMGLLLLHHHNASGTRVETVSGARLSSLDILVYLPFLPNQ